MRAFDLLYKNHLKKNRVLSTVSGVLTTEPDMIKYFDKNITSCDIITTKSYQKVQTFGHREPIICSPEPGSFGNFVGLRNPGLDKVLPELEKIKKDKMRAVLNISLAANSIDDFVYCIDKVKDIADIVELNFSCPHASKGFGASIGSDASLVREYVKNICSKFEKRQFLLIIKLTPNVENIDVIAKSAIDSGADGVALINTLGPFDYKDPLSSQSIFNANEGGKGGLSGRAVKAKALECVRKVRKAISDEPIILGMGGVESADDVSAMLEAGADSVGIGSALSLVDFYDYEKYFKALKCEKDVSSLLKDNYSKLLYRKHEVISCQDIGDNCVLLELTGNIKTSAGEFVFLWIPQLGEKPFSVSSTSPLRFVIKRRGALTNALCDLKKGDVLYSRGPYGKPLDVEKSKNALLLAGGSGFAVLPLIADSVSNVCDNVVIKVGLSGDGSGSAFAQKSFQNLSKYGKVEYVYDQGKVGRVIDTITKEAVSGDTKAYIIGPTPMMRAAASRLVELGMRSDDIYVSVESLTLCGIGMCGECVCGSKLPCKEGTFYKYSQIEL